MLGQPDLKKETAYFTGEQDSGFSSHRHLTLGVLLRDSLNNMAVYECHAEPDAMEGVLKYV
jgi:hypothetical protein